MKALLATLMLLSCSIASGKNQDTTAGDAILGIWKAEEKTLTIEVYRRGDEYQAKIISFTDHHSDVPSAERTDEHNPDETLRSRKLVGLAVLSGLHYSQADNEWTDGHIYDVGSGSSYKASASLSDGTLSVRAFKGISLLGKTLHFQR